MTGRLTPRQQRFVEEYLVDCNATQAAVRAGYAARSADDRGSRLLQNPAVAAAVAAGRAALAEKCGIDAERVVREVAALAFSDVRKLLNEDGSVKPLGELDDLTAAAIASVEVVAVRGAEGGAVRKIKLWDKNSAQERLCKHLGLFERDNKQKSDPLAEFLKEISGKGLPVVSDGE